MLIASLAVGLIATVLVVWMGIVKEHHWDMLREEARTKIAQVESETAKVLERAAGLEKDAAEARAQANKAALELELLRISSAPRQLRSDLKRELEGKPKAPVQIWYLPDVSDGWSFAFELRVSLSDAGWEVTETIPIPEPDRSNSLVRDLPRAAVAGGQPSGITVVGNPTSAADSEGTPYEALLRAIARSTGLPTNGAFGSPMFMPVPPGMLRVVIADKQDLGLRTELGPAAPASPDAQQK